MEVSPRKQLLSERSRIANNDESRASSDPVEVLGRSLMELVSHKLGASDLGRCLAVCKGWKSFVMDDFVWKHHCERLCQGKLLSLHVSNMPKYDLYKTLEQESRRTKITVDDLCRNSWKFRFKQGVDHYWKSCDPHWHGQPPMKRVFHEDGFISAEPDDLVWGGHECCWSLIPPSDEQAQAIMVQINSWPPLSVTRTPTWGWKMENSFVVYYSEPLLLDSS